MHENYFKVTKLCDGLMHCGENLYDVTKHEKDSYEEPYYKEAYNKYAS